MSEARQITEEEATRAAEYVLGLMSAAERRAFEAEMAASPALRDEVRGWDRDMAPLAEAVEPVEPDPDVQSRLEARLFGAPVRGSIFARLGFWRGLSVVTLAATAALATVVVLDRTGPSGGNADQPVYVAELAAENGPLRLVAVYDPASGMLQVNRSAGAAAPGRALELWLIEGETAPVSLGVLPEDRRARLAVPDDLAAHLSGAVLAISDEPPGGSPTGAPTGPVLAMGQITGV